MDIRSLLNRLEAWVQEELRARERTLGLLGEQERAIVAGDAGELERATRALEAEILIDAERARRLANVLARLQGAWDIPAGAMTLGSIAERAGADGARLTRLRDELREVTARVVRQNRRVAALTSAHRRLVQDVIQTLFQDAGGTPLAAAGTLIDAEA